MKVLDITVSVLLIIGALSWGLAGLFGFNVVAEVLDEAPAFTRMICAIIGLSGLYEAFNFTIGYDKMHNRWCSVTTA